MIRVLLLRDNDRFVLAALDDRLTASGESLSEALDRLGHVFDARHLHTLVPITQTKYEEALWDSAIDIGEFVIRTRHVFNVRVAVPLEAVPRL